MGAFTRKVIKFYIKATCTHIHIRICMCIYNIYIHIFTYTHTCMYVHVCVCVYVCYLHSCICTYIRAYIHTYIHTYIHSHTFTDIHIHTHNTYSHMHLCICNYQSEIFSVTSSTSAWTSLERAGRTHPGRSSESELFWASKRYSIRICHIRFIIQIHGVVCNTRHNITVVKSLACRVGTRNLNCRYRADNR